ncbi:hypothetical protein KEM56_006743 [Ascosphaera pollenicola]|nr:hypothetical protein KEM56_006743 [Ascosphaera pollenicola]
MSDHSLHLAYIRRCLDLARLSPPKPTNFRVGSILLYRQPKPSSQSKNKSKTKTKSSETSTSIPAVASDTYEDTILSTGYTLELEGNTHAEQCCLAKYGAGADAATKASATTTTTTTGDGETIMYVTMEPCGKRLSGNEPCAKRIAATRSSSSASSLRIDKVYFGVKEPGTFVRQSIGCKLLDEAGVDWELVQGLEREILSVATEGHVKSDEEREREVLEAEATKIGAEDMSAKQRTRQAGVQRNPMKRMMEAELE